jgi:hypothetical protein
MRDWFEMIDTNASRVPTNVIELDTFRKRASQECPNPNVCRAPYSIEHCLRVPIGRTSQSPGGNVAGSAEVNLLKQSGRQTRISYGRHRPKDTKL